MPVTTQRNHDLLVKLLAINEVVLDTVPFVNYGGCGFYAALVQQRLSELGQKIETGAIRYTPPDGADHIFTVVKIGRTEYFHDGEDTKPLKSWTGYKYERLDPKTTQTVVNSNRWNTMFEPKVEVPILCSIIETVLGPFEQRPHFDTIQGVRV